MRLDDAMFVSGALIFDRLKSHAVEFRRPRDNLRSRSDFQTCRILACGQNPARVFCASSPGRVMRPLWDLQVNSRTNPVACR